MPHLMPDRTSPYPHPPGHSSSPNPRRHTSRLFPAAPFMNSSGHGKSQEASDSPSLAFCCRCFCFTPSFENRVMGQSMMTHTCSPEAEAGQLPWVPYKMWSWHLNGMLVGLDTKCVARALTVCKTKRESTCSSHSKRLWSLRTSGPGMVLLHFL